MNTRSLEPSWTLYLRKSSPTMFIVQVTFCKGGLENDEHLSGFSLLLSTLCSHGTYCSLHTLPTYQLIDTSLPHQNKSEKTAVRHARIRYAAMHPRNFRILGSVTGTMVA